MKIVALSFRYLISRPMWTGLNVLLLSLGIASITTVLLVHIQIDRAFARDLAGIDVVVGAKGSPMQLILAGVFHIDVPPGNISWADVEALGQDPRVKSLIPLSLGDSFAGYRIVGTTPDYITHYEAKFAAGNTWKEPFQVVLGANVAKASSRSVGDQFFGSHGLGGGGAEHTQHPYRVSGVLQTCGCAIDRLVLTALESVWQVHEKETATDPEEKLLMQAERETSLALIRYSSPLAAVTFPRYVNESTPMQAAVPALEITRLLRMVGVGSNILNGLGAVLFLTAGLSVFIALFHAVRERRADLALLRMLGASPYKLSALLVCEALWLVMLATFLGLSGGHLLTGLVGYSMEADQSINLTGWIWVGDEVWIVMAATGVGLVAALLPAWSAFRVSPGLMLNSRGS